MKSRILVLALFALLLAITSCQKDEASDLVLNEAPEANYLKGGIPANCDEKVNKLPVNELQLIGSHNS